MPPAILFGLTNAVRTSVQTAPAEPPAANVPVPASN
jgi:hypothetical protein